MSDLFILDGKRRRPGVNHDNDRGKFAPTRWLSIRRQWYDSILHFPSFYVGTHEPLCFRAFKPCHGDKA